MVRCKICDVRDYATARLCAELGADYIGVHCIEGIKAKRRDALLDVVTRIPNEYPNMGVVLVTLVTDDDQICSMLSILHPSHIQLHSEKWSGTAIQRLRAKIAASSIGMPKIVAFANVASSSSLTERIADVCHCADMLLLDITDYSVPERPSSISPAAYGAALVQATKIDIPTFIAGGLTPDNVLEYLSIARPWGVDVQRGVELPCGNGQKDGEKLRTFLRRVKEFEV